VANSQGREIYIKNRTSLVTSGVNVNYRKTIHRGLLFRSSIDHCN